MDTRKTINELIDEVETTIAALKRKIAVEEGLLDRLLGVAARPDKATAVSQGGGKRHLKNDKRPRDFLKPGFAGLSVSIAVNQAVRILPGLITAARVGPVIFDYRGMKNRSRARQAVASALCDSKMLGRVSRGVYIRKRKGPVPGQSQERLKEYKQLSI